MLPPLRFIDRLKFFVERQFVKGGPFQLLVVGAIIALISITGGLLTFPAGEGKSIADAIWWAFLRLTDPGYLGDDEGSWVRFVSTLLTLSGYVVFMGALVAILTRSLINRMTELERGLTPVAYRNHVVILGWSSRTLPLIRELVGASDSMRSHLLGRSRSRLKLVVLAEDMSAEQAQLLRNDPEIGRKARQIVLRSGSALQPDALHRAACLNAAAVIIPSRSHEQDSLVSADVETIKALMSLNAQARARGVKRPFVVAEIQDLRKVPIAQRAYEGPLQVVAGDAMIASLIAQTLLHPGLSALYNELLTDQSGNELYVRSGQHFQGETLAAIATRCPRALVCGMLSPQKNGGWNVRLNAPSNTQVGERDKVVMMALDFRDTEPGSATQRRLETVERKAPDPRFLPTGRLYRKRILILGWSARLPALIHELASYQQYQFDLDIVSIVPAEERRTLIERYQPEQVRVSCRHIETDFMQEGELHDIDLAQYDGITLMSSDLLASGEEADARAIVGQSIIEEHIGHLENPPQILLELSDPDNAILLGQQRAEMLISPLVLSHLLAQVALRPELRAVFDELFTVGGAEIVFRSPAEYSIGGALPFWKLERLAAERGETAMGVFYAHAVDGRRLHLNPARETALDFQPEDQLVILTDTGIHKGDSQE
ncbi:CASTOR/POLLUX-related putative ion channel [Marinimicrobium sp. ARAG 43.8]|uniref:CASTOR/POLLUX-related putative ion channel n=1 Tax=Marinimicrobium sp. ARAG 43.8 TaxID=3418719 RepID=UPI003CF501C6